MRVKVDENLPEDVVGLLRAAGHEAVSVPGQGIGGALDAAVLDVCQVEPRYGNLYRALQQSLPDKARCLLLATATPMQLDPVEVADLILLTRRVGAFEQDPALMNAEYELLAHL